jgi:hypothetical protein
MEFTYRFRRQDDAELIGAYPELLNEHVDTDMAISMYRRFAKEADAVLGAYPGLAGLLA